MRIFLSRSNDTSTKRRPSNMRTVLIQTKHYLVKRKEYYGTAYHVKALGAAKVDQLQDTALHNKNVSTFDVSVGQRTA